MPTSEDTYDVIVVGSGAGALVGAYAAASRGLRTLVVEKTPLFGGTTAYSGGGAWFPGSAPLQRAGIGDNTEDARTYLRDIVADDARIPLQDAYLSAGAQLIEELERNAAFGAFTYGPVPDYFHGRPGATAAGSTVFPAEITVEEMGELAALVRTQIPSERFGIDPGPALIGGRALVGRALKAFMATGNGSYLLETALENLIVEDGKVVGIEAIRDGEQIALRARRGVLLAAGGFERNAEMRAEHGSVPLTGEWSNGAPLNTGDAITAGVAAGAGTDLLDEAWFVPGLMQPDGKPIFQTGIRGGIWVNGAGERFLNESMPYDRAGHEMARLFNADGVAHVPAYWVFDQRVIDRDSFGGDPELPVPEAWYTSGALRKADTIEELAELIGVPADGLRASIEEFNTYGEKGIDEKFQRGETPWDQMFHHVVGFPAGPALNFIKTIETDLPNPLLIPIDQPPYYCATVVLSDIGTKGGLTTDAQARVLRPDGSLIQGLYAAGNTMAAMSGRVYPGAGTPIGSSLAFSYLAALDMAGEGA
ncbi:FAD-binding protein [Nocardia sp. XZ_19_231]|uniref:FAD-binding protein n=1 Tax=Nocardia sp. XZ_19_231 TaxID=2769252 RepID=UPI00188FCA6F|nr:FAD-binding protein [Nocardia sp. XZ_19_231]